MDPIDGQRLYLIRHQVAQRITQQQRAYNQLRAAGGSAEPLLCVTTQISMIEAELRWLTALRDDLSTLINS